MGQIDTIHTTINKARSTLGADHFFDVRYEDLIADVHRVLDTVAVYAAGQDIQLASRGNVPREFSRQSSHPLPADLEQALAAALERRCAAAPASSAKRSGSVS